MHARSPFDPTVGGPFVSIEISHRLHATTGSPDRSVLLPALPGAGLHQPSVLDRIGEQVQSKWPLVAAGSVGGGVIGSMLLRGGGGGIFRGIVGGIAGVLGGAAITIGASTLLGGDRAHRGKPAPSHAAPPNTGVPERERVKVMTWNIHGGMGGPGKYGSSEKEMDRLADAIRREQPDVVLLQEVDHFATRSNHSDNLAELDERLDPTSTVAASPSTTITGRDQDVAIMTFNGYRITDARNIVHQDPRGGGLPTRLGSAVNQAKAAADHVLGTKWAATGRNGDYQVRNTIEAMVRTPGGSDVRVLSGHYEGPNERFDHQELQVGDTARAIAPWKGPTIWGGDFNVRDASPNGRDERELLAHAGLRDTLAGTPQHEKVSMTEVALDPAEMKRAGKDGGIDRIYASDHARILGARVVREAGTASDHLPVVAELELVPATPTTRRP